MQELSSPNHDKRPSDTKIDTIVLHYTGMRTAQEALNRLCDPEAKVSAHYVIDEDGTIHKLVSTEYRAWHAGKSLWRGKENVNDYSVGIEMVNPGHEFGYRAFPEKQMEALITLCKDIADEHSIDPRNVVGHSDIAPARKQDPGELFDWKLLAENTIGLWSNLETCSGESLLKKGNEGEEVRQLQTELVRYGYGVVTDGIFETQTEFVVKAFQQHFGTTTNITGEWSDSLQKKLNHLLDIITANS